MDWITQIMMHAPWWVHVLFLYLLSRDLEARKPRRLRLLGSAAKQRTCA